MKILRVQLFVLAMVVIAFLTTSAVAQSRIKFDKNGSAKISTSIKAKSKATYSISGKDFNAVRIQFNRYAGLDYELRRGSEFLSSGHCTGLKVAMQSDGKATYYLTIINDTDKPRPIALTVVKTVGGKSGQ